MKNIIKTTAALFMLIWITSIAVSCKKQNEASPLAIQTAPILTAEYLANLRAYKQSPHQIAFGWFGGSGGTGATANMENRWEGIPDSVDLISLWGGPPVLGSHQDSAMKYVQVQKGTKVLFCTFDFDTNIKKLTGADFITKYVTGDTTLLKQGLDVLAKALSDTVTKYNLDGIDLDHEPSATSGFLQGSPNYPLFMVSLSKYFGPMSGTGKILAVDGLIRDVGAGYYKYITYGLGQDYGLAVANLSARYMTDGGRTGLPLSKWVTTEDFESYWSTGGSLVARATTSISGGAKAGFGAYHLEYDYQNTPTYKYMRNAIQAANPAVH